MLQGSLILVDANAAIYLKWPRETLYILMGKKCSYSYEPSKMCVEVLFCGLEWGELQRFLKPFVNV